MNRNAERFFKLALEYIHNSNYISALSALDRAIQLDPENPKYYLKRGALTSDFDEYAFGVEDFTKVIAYSNDLDELTEAYSYRCSADEHLGRIDELLSDLTWLIDHKEGDPLLYSWRGVYEQRRKQFEAALKDFDAAYQLLPTGDNLLKRAQAYYSLERYDEALQHLTQILSMKNLHSNFLATVYRWRGSAYYKPGNHRKALADFSEELRLKGVDPVDTVVEYIEKYYGLAG